LFFGLIRSVGWWPPGLSACGRKDFVPGKVSRKCRQRRSKTEIKTYFAAGILQQAFCSGSAAKTNIILNAGPLRQRSWPVFLEGWPALVFWCLFLVTRKKILPQKNAPSPSPGNLPYNRASFNLPCPEECADGAA